jgi:hypothetical protein
VFFFGERIRCAARVKSFSKKRQLEMPDVRAPLLCISPLHQKVRSMVGCVAPASPSPPVSAGVARKELSTASLVVVRAVQSPPFPLPSRPAPAPPGAAVGQGQGVRWGPQPQAARSRTPPTSAPFAKKVGP